MPERLHCPACQPSPALADIGAALQVDGLHRCTGCRGVLASHRAVQHARRHVSAAHPALRVRQAPHRCRRCQSRAAASATHCPQCAASLVLACPRCQVSMTTLEVLGIVVDVCRPCELTFFDAGEFAHACNDPQAFARAVQPVGARASTGAALAVDAVELALSAPDTVELVAHGARAAGHLGVEAASHAIQAASSVDVVVIARAGGEVAVGAAHVAAEAAGDTAETILEVIAALFDGL